MSKLLKMSAAAMMLAAFASCSSDEPLAGGGDGGSEFNGSTAYMKIRIEAIGDRSRAGETETTPVYPDNSFADGNADEHAINNVQFFFFDKDGLYYSVHNYLMSTNFVEDNPADANVEYLSKDNILVIEGIKEKSLPKFLLTVINAPGFTAESTLAATSQKLIDYKTSVTGDNNATTQYFVMSTSAYKGRTDEETIEANKVTNVPDYVNVLHTGNLYESAAEAQSAGKSVEIYVERVAAKVELSVAANIADKATYTKDGKSHTIYKLSTALAGSDNNDGNNEGKASKSIYVEILGWGLNATANSSYVSKQIGDWAATDLWTGWNDATRSRSYWAKACNYGYDYDADAYDSATSPIKYIAPDDATLGLSTSDNEVAAYCNEHTNSLANTFYDNGAANTQNITHVLLNTRLCDENGDDIKAVMFAGYLFEETSYIDYILNHMVENMNDGSTSLPWMYEADATATEPNKKYKVIDNTLFKYEEPTGAAYAGEVHIVLNLAEGQKLYKYNADRTGVDVCTEADLTDLNDALVAAQPTVGTSAAVIGYQGANVYPIAIEHLNKGKHDDNAEGDYGVVRNHWYKLTINEFKRVGEGVFDSSVEFIPNEPKDPLYYMGVTIKVHSWKLVNQSVAL